MKSGNFWLRMLPMVVLVAATVFMSLYIYGEMIDAEIEICWNRLEIATNSTAEKIRIRISDNLNFLTAVADSYLLTKNINNQKEVGKYLNSVVEKTIFERIDVILPNERLITQTGENADRNGKSSFEELVARGSHVTQRITSSFTGEEIICCVTPIEDEGKVLGLLVGTISCRTLSEIFEVFTYGNASQLFLIDRLDGNYLMDNWHSELGNIYELGLRESADGGEMIDFVPAIINGQRARFSFISQTNGERSYQYCAPVEEFNWEVCVVVQEDIVFKNANALKHQLFTVGLVELIVVFIYVLWHVAVNVMAIRSENKAKLLEFEKTKNDARAAFISNMSHDIKTPLNGIVGMLQIIKNHKANAAMVDDCLQKIEISAQYLSTLTSDMLDINEIENNKLILPEEPVDLHRLADELTSIVERQAGDAGVAYSVDHSQLEHPYVIGSSVHIKRILVNLIGNAIKYSKNAGKTVWITMSDEAIEQSPEKRLYRFVIRDNGIGMSEEFQKNMYRAFEQESCDARSEYKGYGLGLTIVSYLIQKMNGVIDLDSVKGYGSTFTVSIPLPVDTDRRQMIGDNDALDLSGLRLLLVEDNDFNMEIARTLLSDAGAHVDTAANGKIATEVFAASNPGAYNAIIMDVMMPVMDGYEATGVIRRMQRPDAGSVPVIAMTANTFSEDVARCLDAGMNAHVPKPLDSRRLMITILDQVAKSQAAAL